MCGKAAPLLALYRAWVQKLEEGRAVEPGAPGAPPPLLARAKCRVREELKREEKDISLRAQALAHMSHAVELEDDDDDGPDVITRHSRRSIRQSGAESSLLKDHEQLSTTEADMQPIPAASLHSLGLSAEPGAGTV